MIDCNNALQILREHEAELRGLGIARAAIFGSVARNEARDDSDLDVLIELIDKVQMTVFDYVGIKQAVAELFAGEVDVVSSAALKPAVRRNVKRDAIYAF